jgi:hypothetical protein
MPKQGSLSGLNEGLGRWRAIKILKKIVANLPLPANNPGKASVTTLGQTGFALVHRVKKTNQNKQHWRNE